MAQEPIEVLKHIETGRIYGTKDGIFYKFRDGGHWIEHPVIPRDEFIELDSTIFGRLYETLILKELKC